MTDRHLNDFAHVFDTLREKFSHLDSPSEIEQATVDSAADILNPDVSLIAEKDNGGLTPLVSRPTTWSDTDGLLSPASVASIIASRGSPHLVADRSDVRSATEINSLSRTSAFDIGTVLVVPFGVDTVIMVGNCETGTFTETDLEILGIVSSFATNLATVLETSGRKPDRSASIAEAMAGLSHDAQNFFSVIEGRLSMAREDPRPEHFDAIERATHRLQDLIADTNTLLETGTHASKPEPVSLEEVVHEAWELEHTERANFNTGSLATIRADRSRLNQLVENIIRNAMEHAGPDVTVKVGMLPNNEGFYIEDDGPGIDPEERDNVMQFAYSTSEGNTGFGLTIVQWIASAHGWNVLITESRQGGTRFEFDGVAVLN